MTYTYEQVTKTTKKITKKITEEEIYGSVQSSKQFPGFNISGFRPPQKGDYYLNSLNYIIGLDTHGYFSTPRLIFKKIEKVLGEVFYAITVFDIYGKDVDVPAGYKAIRFGIAKNEDFISPIDFQIYNGSTTAPRIIVEKE